MAKTLKRKKPKTLSTALKPSSLLLHCCCNKSMFVSGVTPHWKTSQFSSGLVQPQHYHSPWKRLGAPNLCTSKVFLPVLYLLLEQLELKWRTAAGLAAAHPKWHRGTRFCGCPSLKCSLNNNFSSCRFFFWCSGLIQQTHAISWL